MKKLFLVLAISLSLLSTSYPQVWEPFGDGVDNRVNSLTFFGNELLAGGWFTVVGEKDISRVARWTGTNWTGYGSISHLVTSLQAYNNELYSGSNYGVLKWTGTNWSAPGDGVNNSVYALTIYNDELIVAGDFTIAGTVSANKIARWNGTTWSSLGTGLNGTVYALTVYNNELIVGGNFSYAGEVNANKIAKWNGSTWSVLGSGLSDTVFALSVYNGNLIAGGSFLTAGGSTANKIAKWNGANWSSVGNGIVGNAVYALAILINELVAGGNFSTAGSVSANNIAKWNGTTWSALGSGTGGQTTPSVRCFTIYNNELVAGGDFLTAGGVTVNRIAKWKTNFTVSGFVRYSDNNQPATNGSVKAIKLNRNTGNIIVYDSAQIQSDGSYVLSHVPQDSVDIGIYPNSTTQNDWVSGYYPSTIYWEQATILYPTENLTNVNIGAIRMVPSNNPNSVNGKVMRLNDIPLSNLKDAVLYAKDGNTFVRCTTSDAYGIYHLNYLPAGNLKVIVNRLGFSSDSTMVSVTATSNIDSVNFYLHNLSVGINKIESTIPTEFILFQNYPNPFNPKTIIKFQIKDLRFVTLKIYNIAGKEIATLVNGKQSPGLYEVTFDASSLSSGVYFYKLVAGDYLETKKMILIK